MWGPMSGINPASWQAPDSCRQPAGGAAAVVLPPPLLLLGVLGGVCLLPFCTIC